MPQILFPGIIAEQSDRSSFSKAIAALAVASFVLFIVPAVVGFAYLGQYATAPDFGSLEAVLRRHSSVRLLSLSSWCHLFEYHR